MRIAVCCATNRGLRFLERLRKLAPESELVVFSFKETAGNRHFVIVSETSQRLSVGNFLRLVR